MFIVCLYLHATYIQRSFDLDGSKFNQIMDACVVKSFQFESITQPFFLLLLYQTPHLFEGYLHPNGKFDLPVKVYPVVSTVQVTVEVYPDLQAAPGCGTNL